MDHKPVLVREVVEMLNVSEGKLYIDCTFGAGGYSAAILEKKASVIAIDQDPTTQKYAKILEEKYGDKFRYINGNFRDLGKLIENHIPVDGVVYDLGVSSMQLDNKERGFSFQQNAKLDMRMSNSGISAYDIVNEKSEEELADIIFYYGEEHFARRIAHKIVEKREEAPIETTFELAEIVRSVCYHRGKIDPSTKTFQAIRIAVNDELIVLEKSLSHLSSILKIGARAAVVSFHALEDRIVKKFFIENSEAKIAKSKYAKFENKENKPFKLITRKSIKPSKEEIQKNPRSRSAHLRVIEKLENYHE